MESGAVTHFVTAGLSIHDHLEKRAFFYVTQLTRYPIVLKIPWLKQHDLTIRYSAHTVLFDSNHCRNHCDTPLRPTKI